MLGVEGQQNKNIKMKVAFSDFFLFDQIQTLCECFRQMDKGICKSVKETNIYCSIVGHNSLITETKTACDAVKQKVCELTSLYTFIV